MSAPEGKQTIILPVERWQSTAKGCYGGAGDRSGADLPDGAKDKKSEMEHIYIALNKPRGITCTTKNDKNNFIDYLQPERRVFPVVTSGKDSQGLLILTSDGKIVNPMMRAASGHDKEYVVAKWTAHWPDLYWKDGRGIYLDLDVTTRAMHCAKITTKKTFSLFSPYRGLNQPDPPYVPGVGL